MYLVIDTETTMYGGFEKDSNPFYKDKILCIGLKYQKTLPRSKEGNYVVDITDLYKKCGYNVRAIIDYDKLLCVAQDTPPIGWLENVKIIVGHNIKFDLLFLWRNHELQKFFSRGGRIYDCQLAEYLLSGQRHKYPALRNIAINKYGCKERVKNIEVSKKKGLLTQDMHIELLLEDVKNDVLDTEQVMLKQIKIAKQQQMFTLVMEQMEGLLSTCEMEFNGMFINEEIFNKNKKNLELDVASRENQLQDIIRGYWYEL